MHEKPKNERETLKKPAQKKPKGNEESEWGNDQKERDYYYDDTFGYEVYVPEKDKEIKK